jgi:hypothetical protein
MQLLVMQLLIMQLLVMQLLVMQLLVMQLFVMQSRPVTTLILGPNIFLSTLFSNTLSLSLSINQLNALSLSTI